MSKLPVYSRLSASAADRMQGGLVSDRHTLGEACGLCFGDEGSRFELHQLSVQLGVFPIQARQIQCIHNDDKDAHCCADKKGGGRLGEKQNYGGGRGYSEQGDEACPSAALFDPLRGGTQPMADHCPADSAHRRRGGRDSVARAPLANCASRRATDSLVCITHGAHQSLLRRKGRAEGVALPASARRSSATPARAQIGAGPPSGIQCGFSHSPLLGSGWRFAENIGTEKFTGNSAVRFFVESPTQRPAKPISYGQRFAQIADRCSASGGIGSLLHRIKSFQVCAQFVHAGILPFGNYLSTPFGKLPLRNGHCAG